MSDGDPLTARVAALAAVVVLAAACNGETADDRTDPSDAAASPDPTSDSTDPEDATSPSPTPTPTPTQIPTGPDDEGWAEHLGLTEEELEERRASDDFLEFAEARRAREHPRFDSTHGNIGFESAPGELDVSKEAWVTPLNVQDVADNFLLPFRDTLLAEGLEPATGVPVSGDHMGPEVDGGYVSRINREESEKRQILMAVAFYRGDRNEPRGRLAMAAAEVNITDAEHHHGNLMLNDVSYEVADVEVQEDWSETWREQVADAARTWGEPREFE